MFANSPPAPPEMTPAADGALRALAAAVDEVLAADPAGWSDESLAVAMVEMRRQHARLAAAVVEATAAFDARRAWADDGSRGAADWIAARARLPRREVRADLRLGRRLRAMPATRAALRAGQIGQAHAHRLAGLAGNPRTAAAFAESEALLVRNATAMRHDDFERTCDHWRDAADPDGPERRLAPTTSCAGSTSRPGSTASATSTATSRPPATQWWAARSSGSRPSCSGPTGPRHASATATPPPSPTCCARRPSAATTLWSRWRSGP